MTRQTQTFGITKRQSGPFEVKLLVIISALTLVGLTPAIAGNPVPVQAKNTASKKEVQATTRKSAHDKIGSSKGTSGKEGRAIDSRKANSVKIAKGKLLFDKLTCSGCHPNGENSLHPYRPLKGPGFVARYKEDGQIELLIRTGVLKAGMPSFSKARLNDDEMKDLIAYIRSLTPQTVKK